MKENRKSRIWWSVGGFVLTMVGLVVIPVFIDKYSNKLYKSSLKKESINFDNLGPEIVKNELRED